jgi:hypothetical protein
MLVIPLWKVIAKMRAAAFMTGQCRLQYRASQNAKCSSLSQPATHLPGSQERLQIGFTTMQCAQPIE